MGIIFNTTTINSIYMGGAQVNKAYFGDVLVFGGEPTPSGITITSDGKGLIIPQGTTIQSYREESGKYTLPTDVTIPNVSENGRFSAEGIMGNYSSGVVVTNQTTQTGKIFGTSPLTVVKPFEYNGKNYHIIDNIYQEIIREFSYSGSSYKTVLMMAPFNQYNKGVSNKIIGAFGIEVGETAKLTKFNVKLRIQQVSSGSETTLKALYAVDRSGNLLKEVTNISVADGIRYIFPQINGDTIQPIYILADIDFQDADIQLYLSAYCQDVTDTTNYDTTLYFKMNDNGDMAGNRYINARATTQALPEALCTFKVSSDGNIYDLTT